MLTGQMKSCDIDVGNEKRGGMRRLLAETPRSIFYEDAQTCKRLSISDGVEHCRQNRCKRLSNVLLKCSHRRLNGTSAQNKHVEVSRRLLVTTLGFQTLTETLL